MKLVTVCDHTFIEPKESSIVLDLGSNRGEFAKTMIQRYKSHVYGVEPNPDLSKSLAEIPYERTLQVAAAGKQDKRLLHIHMNPESSSIHTSPGSEYESVLEFVAMPLEAIIKEFDLNCIDLLKMDIEGAEIELIQQTSDRILRESVHQISVEFHLFSGLIDQASVDMTLRRLRRLGFYVVDFSRSYFDVLFINRRLMGITFLNCIKIQFFERWKRRLSKKIPWHRHATLVR
jgi:FkbM family methyltransferase